MAVSSKEIIFAAVGFLLLAIMTPIGMKMLVDTNTTFGVTGTPATFAAVYTIFTILLPILYIIGCALYFIPKFRG